MADGGDDKDADCDMWLCDCGWNGGGGDWGEMLGLGEDVSSLYMIG
jgi:hypothetical protein